MQWTAIKENRAIQLPTGFTDPQGAETVCGKSGSMKKHSREKKGHGIYRTSWHSSICFCGALSCYTNRSVRTSAFSDHITLKNCLRGDGLSSFTQLVGECLLSRLCVRSAGCNARSKQQKNNVSNVVYVSGSFSLVIEKKKKGVRKIELEAY